MGRGSGRGEGEARARRSEGATSSASVRAGVDGHRRGCGCSDCLTARWAAAGCWQGIDVDEMAEAVGRSFTPEQMSYWTRHGFVDATHASWFRDEFGQDGAEEAGRWLIAGEYEHTCLLLSQAFRHLGIAPPEALAWHKAGFGTDEAVQQRSAGRSPREAAAVIGVVLEADGSLTLDDEGEPSLRYWEAQDKLEADAKRHRSAVATTAEREEELHEEAVRAFDAAGREQFPGDPEDSGSAS